MIQARTITDITEAYLTSYTLDRGYVEVFVNPTKKELVDLINTYKHDPGYEDCLRFSAVLATKRVYVWHGELDAHHYVKERLGIHGKGKGFYKTGILDGTAEQQGPEFVMVDSDMLDAAKDRVSLIPYIRIYSRSRLAMGREIYFGNTMALKISRKSCLLVPRLPWM